ncbi:MAG: ferredoxin--NADP reductase [Lewinellaceae bacterium]|nr:ferredoxin--NADP reductase [Lewinellaceae bacterium]
MATWINWRVIQRKVETTDTVSLYLEPVEPLSVEYQAGQFLTLLFPEGDEEVRRAYSLSSAPGIDPFFRITVRRQPNGVVSSWLTRKVREGDMLVSLPPAGSFVLSPSPGRPRDLVLVGGGSGIAPLLGILKAALTQEPATTVTLLLANRQWSSVVLREELQQWAQRFPERLRCHHYLSMPEEPLVDLREQVQPASVYWGRLSNAVLESQCQQAIQHSPDDAHFFLCGPEGLLLKAGETLGYLGYGAAQIHREHFHVATPFRPTPEVYPQAFIYLQERGREQLFAVAPGQTILEGAEAAGIELPYSCRSGSCTTCVRKCLAGRVDLFTAAGHMTTAQTNGLVYTCVGYPLTDKVVLA